MNRKSILLVLAFAIVTTVCATQAARAQFGPPNPKTPHREQIDPDLQRKYNAILDAAKQGDWRTVKRMLRDKPELIAAKTDAHIIGGMVRYNIPIHGGLLLLHIAAEQGHNKMVTFLLSRGADINVEDAVGWTPIFYAAATGQSGTVKYLLGRGADTGNVKGEVPLVLVAVQSGDQRTIHLLRNAGVSAGSPLLDMIVDEDTSALRNLLSEDPSCLRQRIGYLYDTPLHWAVLVGDADIVKMMLDYDADPNPDTPFFSPCELAIDSGNIEIATMLLDADASELQSSICMTLAVKNGDMEMVKLLIKYGYDLKDTKNTTIPLLFFCNDTEIAEFLLDQGLDINKHDRQGLTALHAAASRGHKELVLFLLSRGAKLQIPGAEQTPLHVAAECGHLEIVRILLDRGIDINTPDKKGGTPLLSALASGQNEVAKFLIRDGASVTVYNKNGIAALYLAASINDPALVQMIIDKGGDVNACAHKNPMMGQAGTYGYPVEMAAISGNAEVMEMLIRNGADLTKANPLMAAINYHQPEIAVLLIEKYPDDVLSRNSANIYALTANKAPEIFIMLVERAADVNKADEKGYTLMHFAAIAGNNKAIEILIKRGANVNTRTNEKPSRGGMMGARPAYNLPVEKAAEKGKDATVKLLLKNGAQPGATLHIYINNNDMAMCEYLLAKGARTDNKDWRGYTPLHAAVNSNNPQIIQLLLDKGADINAHNDDGETPLHFAVTRGKPDLIKPLIDRGADVNAADNKGMTPLHAAAMKANKPMLQILLEGGADPNIKDKQGKTARDYVEEKIKAFGDAPRRSLLQRKQQYEEVAKILEDAEKRQQSE